MSSSKLFRGLLALLLLLAFTLPASAAITLYDNQHTTFTTDGFFNTFYVNGDQDVADHQQARIKMGFLPNYVGFNFSKQDGNLKMGGRSSFWVTINDSDVNPTDTPIDVRQFYGTVDGDWGQVLFGKDFTLFNRTNIFLDEILTAFGKSAGLDANGVSFGNIGSGYTYPLPSAQITYRTPDIKGLKVAVGLIDPARTNTAADAEEKMPRIEGEATFSQTFNDVAVTAWAGFLTQTSKSKTAGDVSSKGISYGLQAKVAGFSLSGSGFTGSGLNTSLGAFGTPTDGLDSSGHLIQGSYTFGPARVAASYGKTKADTALSNEDKTLTGAVFYSVNSNLTLVADYTVEKFTDGTGAPEEKINTLALGATLSF